MDDCSSVRHCSLEDNCPAVVTSDSGGSGVLPGEVENVCRASVPSCHMTCLEVSTTGLAEGTRQQQETQEGMGESVEVVPFALDEDFDYDRVMLSSKHPMMRQRSSLTASVDGQIVKDSFCISTSQEPI